MVDNLIDHRNDVIKCSQLCSETTRLRLVVPLEFYTFYNVTPMVCKSVDHGKLWSICYLHFLRLGKVRFVSLSRARPYALLQDTFRARSVSSGHLTNSSR